MQNVYWLFQRDAISAHLDMKPRTINSPVGYNLICNEMLGVRVLNGKKRFIQILFIFCVRWEIMCSWWRYEAFLLAFTRGT